MGRSSRAPASASAQSLPAQSIVTAAELAAATGIDSTTLESWVSLGFVEPVAPGANEFTAATAARFRRILRVHRDLEVDLDGDAIIVDLLERLEHLEAELTRLKGGR